MDLLCRPDPRPKLGPYQVRLPCSIGHKPPAFEDTAWGKYAGVLFSTASQSDSLHLVLQDMKYLKELSDSSAAFRQFLQNSSYKRSQQRSVLQAITKVSLARVPLGGLPGCHAQPAQHHGRESARAIHRQDGREVHRVLQDPEQGGEHHHHLCSGALSRREVCRSLLPLPIGSKSSAPSRSRTPTCSSRSSTRSTPQSSAASRCTRATSSWTAPSSPA